MAYPTDPKRAALRVLTALEDGTTSPAEAALLAEELDPVLVYVIVSFLRAVYPASNPAATAVLERCVALTSRHPALVRSYREGGEDPVSRWFESEHTYAEFRGRGAELVERIVDKLES